MRDGGRDSGRDSGGGTRQALLEEHVVQAILQADYVDIFSVLGMHPHASGKQQVTVFLPGARQVSVLEHGSEQELGQLEGIHNEGLFSGLLDCDSPLPYRLCVEYPLQTLVLEDPYRFGSLLDENDLYLFSNGTQERSYRILGANPRDCAGIQGVLFAVWAPNAKRVSVVGEFNHWDGRVHVMRRHLASGVWDIFIPGIKSGSPYKYEIVAADGRLLPLKADPYARRMQLRPDTASRVPDKDAYEWQDAKWMKQRADSSNHSRPVSIYEVHVGSWRRNLERGDDFLSYRELVDHLLPYVKDMGFTHIQLMPVSEFPFDGSWGYQPLGMYAPTSRFGEPADFKYFIDAAHQAGLGVLLDWVPAHFPSDMHGLGQFDGTHLYEHADPRKGFHPDWNTLIYNYGRAEVCSYLISNALYWLDEFHVDGLRFDAVASMLYLDYSRKDGEWLPNNHGGRENLEAIELLRTINSRAYFNYPGILMVAEESTAWPGVTDFAERGGLGFGYKWNLGWMNDTLRYLTRDPVYRKYHHNEITFSLLYGFSENFILPLSHDEVVHGKRSILEKMPGDEWQKFANVRACYSFMWTHPGKKLLFMGDEFAQRAEWSEARSLDWHLLEHVPHQGIQRLVRDLNQLYLSSAALYELEHSHEGFEWVDADNHANSVFIYLRKAHDAQEMMCVALNMTPTIHYDMRIGVPGPGFYREVINTDSHDYGGSGQGNMGGVHAEHIASHGRPWSIRVLLPPLAAVILSREAQGQTAGL